MSSPAEAAAVASAKESGRAVTVPEETTEYAEVIANPDGTLTRLESFQPQRVRRGAQWAPVDLTLERRADGSVGPKVAPVDVRLSGGGGGERLAVAARDGVEIGIGWAGSLPAPVLDGPLATYPDVLPGVDLTVRVTAKGFSQLLVVKTRDAAADPRLREIAFPHHARGVTPRKTAAGTIEVVDAAGRVVFGGDASRMWDSAGQPASASRGAAPRGGVEAQESPATSTMDFQVTATATVVKPDPGFLTDPQRVFPVHIDPEYWWAGGKQNHAVVQSAWPNEHNFNRTDGDLADLKAGYQGGYTSRSYFSFDVVPVHGKVIHRAAVRSRVVHSWGCAGGPTELWHAHGLDWGTTWNSQPGWGGKLGDITKANNARYCPSDGAAWVGVDGLVRLAAQDRWANVVFLIKAQNEGRQDDWRRFALDPVLEVVYNSVPGLPGELGMEGGLIPCASGIARPFVFTPTPRLRGRLHDPDAGMLSARFALHRGPLGNSHEIWSAWVHNVPAGSFAEVTVPPQLTEGEGVYNWSMHASDGGSASAWVGNCEFEVDKTAPAAPAVGSEDYPGGGQTPAGGVGQTGAFTVTAASPDTQYFLWSATDQQNDDPKTRVDAKTLGGSAVFRWTPTTEGPLNIFVRGVDRAGNRSPIVRHAVFVAPGDPLAGNLLGHWKLDGDLADSSGAGRTLVAEGGATPVAGGYNAQAVDLGTGKRLHTSGRVLDTARSFSVSAWARLDQIGAWPAAVSQDGATTSGFQLQGTPDGKWSMSMFKSDVNGGGDLHSRAISTAPAQTGVWTHLVGVYDQVGQIRLYVNGALAAEVPHTSLWSAAGDLQVGAGWWNAGRVDFFPGSIDDVRVYQRVLIDREVAALANEAVLRAHYPLAEGSGITSRDAVTGRDASLVGTAAWTTADGKTGVGFTGQSSPAGYGAVDAPRPDLRTDRSYTVSAFVRLNATGVSARTAVSLRDTAFSPFLLQYRPELGQWCLTMSLSPTQEGGWWIPAVGAVEAQRWVHLTGVYDHVRKEGRIYVNGVFSGQESAVVGWNGGGGMKLGGAVWTGKEADAFDGSVRGVRVYAGVLPDERIGQLPIQS
ncbi:LamG-like jellyroll fold domain-containing protein [Actinokineospora spheciospongiae]|uniref:LamG-like jellyroll fold domain-containing protein n=1 Tax=Actinokineospora spheciospongiae TaxID=909613 RepID=UPI000D9078DE|nr:LamG-like jellyroll fold domain-containing protein [Actinokineospora spheciospongiae]PWW60254.1 concanavalin A-like lectin/glucanase superfamily protein [Actinokineospora spheciospongiae]